MAHLHLLEMLNNPIMFKTIKTILMMLLFAGVASAQSFVSGTVVDGADGSPLPGANVVISGTTQGTQTDAEGKFKLRIPQHNFTIQISFIGYQAISKTLKADGDLEMGTISTLYSRSFRAANSVFHILLCPPPIVPALLSTCISLCVRSHAAVNGLYVDPNDIAK